MSCMRQPVQVAARCMTYRVKATPLKLVCSTRSTAKPNFSNSGLENSEAWVVSSQTSRESAIAINRSNMADRHLAACAREIRTAPICARVLPVRQTPRTCPLIRPRPRWLRRRSSCRKLRRRQGSSPTPRLVRGCSDYLPAPESPRCRSPPTPRCPSAAHAGFRKIMTFATTINVKRRQVSKSSRAWPASASATRRVIRTMSASARSIP